MIEKKIKRELYETEKKKNLSDKEKEENYNHLVELVRTLDKKEEHQYHDRDDLDYYGMRDTENLFSNVDDDYYYKPILVKSYLKNIYKYYESRGNKDKKLSVKYYLDKIMPYLSNIINDHKVTRNESKEWKIQINMTVNFISSKDTTETRTNYVCSDNKEITLGNETDDIIKELFKYFLNNSQEEEAILRNERSFVFESADLFSCSIHKISLQIGKSYIKSPEWLINKRATTNAKNKDNKCFQYSITVALNHQNIENHPERISNIKPFIDQYNWKDTYFPAGIKAWKKFERNNKTITLNISSIPHNTKTINLAHKSK